MAVHGSICYLFAVFLTFTGIFWLHVHTLLLGRLEVGLWMFVVL